MTVSLYFGKKSLISQEILSLNDNRYEADPVMSFSLKNVEIEQGLR